MLQEEILVLDRTFVLFRGGAFASIEKVGLQLWHAADESPVAYTDQIYYVTFTFLIWLYLQMM